MSNLIPEVRVNKNGVPVVKHVKVPDAAKPSVAAIPVPVTTYQPLPALKGKELKEAKEILRMAQNGDQDYEDRITGAWLGNDIRAMRILNGVTNGGEHYNSELSIQIVDARTRLGLGDDEDPETYIAKCHKYMEMTEGRGPLQADDFLSPDIMGDESGKIMQWLEANWDDVDEIMDFFEGRPMDEYSAREYKSIWSDVKGFAAKPLRDGFI